MSLKTNVNELTTFIKNNIGTIGAGVGGAALGVAVGASAASAINKSRKSNSSKNRKRKANRNSSSSRTRKRTTPHTAGKRRDTSHKRIRYTKTGQPYIIMASGKARFIKKKGAKRAHKTPGGRY